MISKMNIQLKKKSRNTNNFSISNLETVILWDMGQDLQCVLIIDLRHGMLIRYSSQDMSHLVLWRFSKVF